MPIDLPKRWILKQADEEIVGRQSEQAKISPLLARLLVLRGLADLGSAKTYLSSSLRSDLPSPFTITDMDPADPMDFFLDHYTRQLAAGYTKISSNFQLRVFMKDYDKIGSSKDPNAAPN